MSVSIYNIYVQACKDLARSIVVKSEATARAINEWDKYFYPTFFDEHNKRTWRYYMHLAGQYHPSDLIDGKPSIKILSIDTIEEIDFTVENLKYHRATWREYQKGSTYYQNLIQKHPEKVKLIDGILNPINIDEAIAADDYTILWYDKRFVEENEYTLMLKIQEYATQFFDRWKVVDYEITDELYECARIGVFYSYLPYFIMQARYEKARTIEAHSFHVWGYLGSHQYLDEYRAHLNLFQRMWFYRNIKWVEELPGKMDTFTKLIEVVMTERRLPIAEFQTRQDISLMSEDNTAMYPEVDFKRIPLNMHKEISRAGSIRTIDEIVEKEVPEARDNKDFIEEDKLNAKRRLTRSANRTLSSKVLESLVVDHSKRQAIRPEDVELNEWIYMVTQDLYTAKINVTHPKTASQMPLTQREALITFIYCLMKSHWIQDNPAAKDIVLDPTWIPTITARNVVRRRKPSIEQVRKVIDERYVDPLYVYAADHYTIPVESIISIDKFSEFLGDVLRMKNIHRNLYSFTEDAREHIQVKTITEQYYETVICKLTEKPMTFADFFKYSNIDIENMTPKEYSQLANEITKTSFGQDIVQRNSLREIQGMMIRLLKQLSSYSIQFLKTINEESTIVIDWPYMRYHGKGTKFKAKHETQMTMIDMDYNKAKLYHDHPDPLFPNPLNLDNDASKLYHGQDVNLILDYDNGSKVKLNNAFRMPSVQLKFKLSRYPQPKETEGFINPWEMDKFKVHNTTEQRSRVTVDEETGELITRGVVYVKDDYNGKE